MMNRTRQALPVAALALIAGSVFGQATTTNQPTTQTTTQPATTGAAPDSTVLRGPDLDRPQRPANADRRDGAERAATPRFQIVLGAVRSLNRAEDESLHLTDAQTESIKEIFAAHREATRAFAEEHQEEIAKLREAARAQAQPGGRRAPAGNDDAGMMEDGDEVAPAQDRPRRQRDGARRPADAPAGQPAGEAADEPNGRPANQPARAARERLQEFLANAPHNADAVKKLTAILTPQQQAHIRETMQAQRARAERNAQDAPQRRRVNADRPQRREGQVTESPAQRERRRPGRDD